MAGYHGRLIPEIKSLSNDDGTFEGVLSTYGNVDLVGDIVERGAFDECIKEHGTRWQLLRDHEWSKIIGFFDVISTDADLRIKGSICLDTQDGRDTWALMKFGAIDGMSIGYYVPQGGYRYDEDGVRHLERIELREGSIVGDPANPEARIQAKSRRLARMSRYAKCEFLTKMTPEERDEALAELDELDTEVEDTSDDKAGDGDKPQPPDEPEDAKDGSEPSGETDDEDKDDGGEPEAEDESEDKEDQEDDRTLVDALRDIGKACDDLVARLEG